MEAAAGLQVMRQRVRVQSGGRIELRWHGLPVGAEAEVIVLYEPEPEVPLDDLYGAAPGGFASAEEADRFLRQERDAWDS